MKGLVAYSKPRGKFGRDYIFTVVIDFDESYEIVRIDVAGPGSGTYSCHSCGHYGTVNVIRPTETSKQGSLHFYRYDNVFAGHQIGISLRDAGLIFSQSTYVTISNFIVTVQTRVRATEDVLMELPEVVYPMFLINWDEHIQQQSRPVTVEEELITKVMNNEPITIKELLLEPPKQPLALERGKHFIEGELRYR